MLAQGHEAVRRFVSRDVALGGTPLAVETDFRFKVDEDVVIGRFDRIDERREGIVLVDYKSAAVDDEERGQDRVRNSLRDGQLGLYALAYLETRQVLPAAAELQFINTGVVAHAPVEFEHLERARARVREAAAGIRSASFPARPDARTCAHCDYRLFCAKSATRRA